MHCPGCGTELIAYRSGTEFANWHCPQCHPDYDASPPGPVERAVLFALFMAVLPVAWVIERLLR